MTLERCWRLSEAIHLLSVSVRSSLLLTFPRRKGRSCFDAVYESLQAPPINLVLLLEAVVECGADEAKGLARV